MSKIRFKNSGKTLNDYVKNKEYKNSINDSILKPIGINMPLRPRSNISDSLFEMTYSVRDQIKVNLKNLILTRKGEYLCSPDFGTNIIDIYNSTEIESVEDIAMENISNAVSKYFPYLSLDNFSSQKILETNTHPSYFEIKIDYTISITNEKNQLILKVLTSR